jgi:hypothetical protein
MKRPFFAFPFCVEGCLIAEGEVALSEKAALDLAIAMSHRFLGVAVIEDVGPGRTRLVRTFGTVHQKALDFVLKHAGGSLEREGILQ